MLIIRLYAEFEQLHILIVQNYTYHTMLWCSLWLEIIRLHGRRPCAGFLGGRKPKLSYDPFLVIDRICLLPVSTV